MLVIRKEQVQTLSEGKLKSFEDEMVLHLAEFSPPLFKVIKEDQMRTVVRLGFDRCEKYGFTLRGPMRLYLEMMLLFGSHFDTDPQYPWAGEIVFDRHSVSEMQRADWLYEKITDYQEKVSGPGGLNTQRVLQKLNDTGREPMTIPPADFDFSLRREFYNIFPEKAEYVGMEGLGDLIRAGRKDAKAFGLTPNRGEILMAVLKFAFGHGCADDPLYPWIGNTLRDEKIVDPKARTERLEKKSFTWLDSVLKNSLGEQEL